MSPRWLQLGAITATVALAAGCGSTPEGLAERSKALRADGRQVLTEMGNDKQEIVRDASEDVECDGEGTKRVFEATASVRYQDDPTGTLGLVGTTLTGLFEGRGYRIEQLATTEQPTRFVLAKDQLQFTVTVEAGSPSSYTLLGETECMQ